MAQAKPQMMSENTHVEGHESQSHGLGQEMHSDTRGYPQQGYNEQSSGMYNGQQQQQNMGQQHMGNNSTYGQGAPQQMNEQSNGAYGGGQQEQQMGNSSYGQGAGQQQMGSSNYTQGAGQQQMGNSNYAQGARQQPMNGGVGQAAEADNRDTITKCNDNLPDYIREFDTSFPSASSETFLCLLRECVCWLLTVAFAKGPF